MTDLDLSSANPNLHIHDSDIIAMEKGPLAWMISKQGSPMNLEDFRRAAVEKFYDVGFKVYLKVYQTNQDGTYAFNVEILDRVDSKKAFDYDKQVHEVVNNILELPDQNGGWIDTDKMLREAEKKAREQGKHKH